MCVFYGLKQVRFYHESLIQHVKIVADFITKISVPELKPSPKLLSNIMFLIGDILQNAPFACTNKAINLDLIQNITK